MGSSVQEGRAVDYLDSSILWKLKSQELLIFVFILVYFGFDCLCFTFVVFVFDFVFRNFKLSGKLV